MWGKFLIIGTIFNLLSNNILFAQKDSIHYHTELFFLSSSQSFQPHWQVSNKWGVFNRHKKNEFVGLFGVGYERGFGKHFRIETEIEFNLKSDISDSYFQQIYLNIHYGFFQLKFGKEAYTIAQYSDELSSGSLFVSNNGRPMPRVGLGFYDFTPIPFIGKLFEFKGMMNFGILDDDRSVKDNGSSIFQGTTRPLYHEKYLYLRTSFLPINVFGGLNHSVLFGGTSASGKKIPVDFWATFFGKGSEKVGAGESSNAAGGHFGLYDIGLDWKIKTTTFKFYYQAPFADDGGMYLFANRDQQMGLLIEFKKYAIIEKVNYEFLNTMWQGGPGVPDAIFNGEYVDLLKVENPDVFMLEQFDTVTVGMTNHQLKKYCEDNLNYGYTYNGRDDYYNNGVYPMGQSYNKYAIGPSLILSKHDLRSISLKFNDSYDRYFVSNRIISHHLALKGYFNTKLEYRVKLTYTDNHGTYTGANKGRGNWGSKEDPEYYNSYYFKDGLKQAYTFLELNYTPFKNKGARFTSSIAYDFGEMYHNFGILFGFHYDGFVKFGKKKK